MARTRIPKRLELVLEPQVVSHLRDELPAVARRTVAAVVAEVEEYADPLRGQLGHNITEAVALALGTFLRLAEDSGGAESAIALQGALDGAYALGRGEARAGRTMAALLAAYRVGARVAWGDWGSAAVEAGTSPQTVVAFAERVFAYIDQLSAASVAGHTDELATSGRVREQYLERLGQALLANAPAEELMSRAERADWDPPTSLTALLISASRVRTVVGALDRRTLVLSADVIGDALPHEVTVVLVPDAGRRRRTLQRSLHNEPAIIGPTRPWMSVVTSYRRVLRVLALQGLPTSAVDTETLLAELVVTADADALADLRASVLSPLDDVPATTRDRLAETLFAWFLHQGRRDDVGLYLHVHPQTVRYRMNQLRSAYGDSLTDPIFVRDFVLAFSGD